MSDRPGGPALLGQARRSLLEELLPLLPDDKRYNALMIANAMAIAIREIEAGDDGEAEERAELRALFTDAGPGGGYGKSRLAGEIRAGRRDGDAAVHRLLTASAVRRQRINNPKVLKASGRE